ncbi:heme-binding protein [Geitlerinema sp. PCC 9228]|jgi:uncharacterized protein GlcG (DUF336 family)|uniref:GlcG/HbpS family heme-binding protein n=1 Tax=Geitlerinema sp. PCC 9228 TaxID=111611 RepID=UPI000A0734C5|nr:heme-binding protein [Geitlerinema sp. PCC 9228]
MRNWRLLGKICIATLLLALVWSTPVQASNLPTHSELRTTLKEVVNEDNGGLGLNMWATVVDRDGTVQAVVYTGTNRGDQWPGSRVIAAQKANTANAFSLPALALSTANLFSAVQPGETLFGLQFSNPVNPNVAYAGPVENIGTANDPMVGKRIGGVNVFGGGLPLYDSEGTLLGALGVSGDYSCADHIIAWKVRYNLNLDNVPKGVSSTKDDNIVYDIAIDSETGQKDSASGWGHPECAPGTTKIGEKLPKTYPTGPES